jgi:large subunit ribosomal protein L21
MTYAIIRTGGMQFRAEPGKTLRVPTIDGEVGANITFDEVLLGSDGTNVHAGTPLVSGAKVSGEIVRHGKGDKIVGTTKGPKINGFTYKAKKHQSRRYGHRQKYTVVEIVSITKS